MAANTSPIFVLLQKTAAVTIVVGDTTALKTLLTAGANGCRVTGITVTTTDTAANDVGLYLQVGGSGTANPVGSKRITARSGDPTVANPTAVAVNLADPTYFPALVLADGSIPLGAGDVLQVGVQATVTSGKTVTVVAHYADY